MTNYVANFELNRNTLEFQGEVTQNHLQADLIIDYRPSKTSQLVNDSGYITILDVPTKLSQFANDTGFITATALIPINNDIIEIKSDVVSLRNGKVDKVTGKGLSTNDFTNAYKTKLEGIETGAQVNKVNSVNGQVGNVTITIPTKTSDITNNSGFITNTVNNLTNYYLKSETYTKQEVNQLIADIPKFKVQIVQALPQTGEAMILYLVPKESTAPDVYDEYIWIETSSSFELIGTTAVDLTGYATEQWVTNQGYITGITSSDVTTALGFTPYSAANPNNYTSVVESTVSGWGFTKNTGTVTSVNNVSPVNGNVTLSIPTVDNSLSTTSKNPVQNKVISSALDDKQDVLTALNAGTNISIINTANRNKTVSGDNSVFLRNAILNGLSAVTLIGACEQSGTPNLSNPIDIVCNNGRLVVENIFDKDADDTVINAYPNVVPIGSTTVINYGGSNNFKALLMPAKPSTEYVFKRLTDCGAYYNRIRVVSLTNSAPPLTTNSGTMLVNVSNTTTSSVTFTTLSTTKGLLISVRDGAVVADDWERFVNNVSVVPTKPLVDGITETVEDSLANTATAVNLLSVGDFRDTQEILTGAITRNVGIKILDGTENWTALSSGVFQLSDGTPNFKSQPNNNIGYSNYFSIIPLSTNIGTYISNGQLGWDDTGVLTISNTTMQTVTDFKQWLSILYVQSTPVIVVYPLATPTTETVTAQSLTTQAGTNVIEIAQASINALSISANYVANDGALISFVNNSGYLTSSDVQTYSAAEVETLWGSIV